MRLRSSAPPAWLALALVLVPASVVPGVQAGSPDDPEVLDPAGDAGPVAAPAGLEWADLRAAWFAEADPDTVRLSIQVVRLDADPPGEVGVHFRVGESWWIAGWTTILFPAPPFSYQGGFYCAADAQGAVPDTSLCESLEASHDSSSFLVALPRALFGLTPGAAIEEPRGYAVDLVSAQPGLGQGMLDRTEPGRAFVLPGPAAAPGEGPGAPAAPAPDAAGPDGGDDGLASPVAAESEGAPGPAVGLAAVALLTLALLRRRLR